MLVAISDIHGYCNKFDDLMAKLGSHPKIDLERDTFVFLGDYVDGGSQTAEVIERLRTYEEYYPHWQFLMGNHEDLMLNALKVKATLCQDVGVPLWDYYLWFMQGGKETFLSYAAKSGLEGFDAAIAQPKDVISQSDIEWLKKRDMFFETDSYIFVHAGLLPNKTIQETSDGNKLWVREQFYDSTYDWGKTVVAGHSFMKQPLIRKNLISLDTMKHGGGAISAVILDDTKRGEVELVQSYPDNR